MLNIHVYPKGSKNTIIVMYYATISLPNIINAAGQKAAYDAAAGEQEDMLKWTTSGEWNPQQQNLRIIY